MLRVSLLSSFVLFVANAPSASHRLGREYLPNEDVQLPSVWREIFGKTFDEQLEKRAVCDSAECQLTARVMRASMNESVDPCEDFYEFACGVWPASDLRPDNAKLPYSLWSLVECGMKAHVREIENREPRADDPVSLKVIHSFYKSCMDTESIEEMGLKPLVSALSRAGGWPMIMEPGEWSEEDFPWQKVDDYYALFTGNNSFFIIGMARSNETNTSFALDISVPYLPEDLSKLFYIENATDGSNEEAWKTEDGLEYNSKEFNSDESNDRGARKSRRKNFLERLNSFSNLKDEDTKDENVRKEYEKQQRKKYTNYVTEVALAVAEAAGAKVSHKKINDEAHQLVQFLIELHEIANLESDITTSGSINNVQKWYDGLNPESPTGVINWVEKMSNLLSAAEIDVDKDTSIELNNEEYLSKLIPLLNKTPSRTLVNFVHWNFLSKAIQFTTKRMKNLHDNWEYTSEIETEKERLNWCESVLQADVVIKMQYLREHYNRNGEKKVVKMVDYLKRAVEEQVKKSKWMDESTRNFILDKVTNLKEHIGIPDWFSNTTLIDHLLSGFVPGPILFENYYSYSSYKRLQYFRVLMDNNTYIDLKEDPLVINAFYAPSNEIEVPAGTLQNPLFGRTRPDVVNYGILGYLLGHEILHGLDTEGRLYDKNGEEVEWEGAMLEKYNDRAECFVRQYNDYANQLNPEEILEDYGNKTVNENMSDVMGLDACYDALKMVLAESTTPQETLPGFERFTDEQIFFISFANSWCANSKDEAIPRASDQDTHSTGKIRVWGSISNSKSFARAFDCAPGTPMNPEEKCHLWD